MEICKQGLCNGCSACRSVCPVGCIEMKRNAEGFLFPVVDESRCVQCGLCGRICPVNAQRNAMQLEMPKAYAAVSKNHTQRKESSSGGVFSLLAEYVLGQGGVVFGAAFDEGFHLRHIVVETTEGLAQLRGSKYVQSEIGDAYLQAKAYLKAGKLVLFTGTPCQIGGLKAYLQKDYENLITQDIICHGVPSPEVWEKYKGYLEKKAGSKLSGASFRDKEQGWKQYCTRFSFTNGKQILTAAREDLYMRAFLGNICLRPSCHDCVYKSVNRISDITLADFWGVQKVTPELDDDQGTSLVFLHSQKGRNLFEAIASGVDSRPVDPQLAVTYNASMITSTVRPATRETFLQELTAESFAQTVAKFCPKKKPTLKSTVKRILRKLM